MSGTTGLALCALVAGERRLIAWVAAVFVAVVVLALLVLAAWAVAVVKDWD